MLPLEQGHRMRLGMGGQLKDARLQITARSWIMERQDRDNTEVLILRTSIYKKKHLMDFCKEQQRTKH